MGAKCSCCEAPVNPESVAASSDVAAEPRGSILSCSSAETAQASVPLQSDPSSPRLQGSRSFWGGYEKLSKILDRDKEDLHSLDWINGIIATCYPHFNEALQKEILPMMREMVSAKVNEIKGVNAITIVEFEFGGETPPQVGPLDVVKRTVEPGTGQAIELQWHLSWETDCNIKMQVTTAVKSFTIGLTKFKFSGEVTVLLCPIVNMLPCVAAVQIYMVSPPTLDFKLQGTLAAGLPEGVATSLNGFIRSNVVKAFQNKLVLPNRIMQISPVVGLLGGKLMLNAGTQVDDLTSVKHPRPELLAEIGAVEARALTAKDTGFLKRATSDPYAIIRLGTTESRTKTVQKTLAPKWAEKGYFDFLVFNARQQVQLEVYDDDALGADDLIGRLPQIEFGDLAKRPKEDWYDIYETGDPTGRVQTDGKALTPDAKTGQMRTGQVKIGYTLFAFSSKPETVKNPPPEKKTAGKSFLQVQVRCLRGLTPETAGGAKVNVSTEGKDNMSQPSKFQKSQDTKLCKATSQRLAEYMIIDQNENADTVAEVSGLSLDTINAIIKNKPSFTCRWFQAIDIIIKDAETAQIDLEVHLKGGTILKMKEPISLASLMEKPGMTDERLVRLERDLSGGAGASTSRATQIAGATMNKTLSVLRGSAGSQTTNEFSMEDLQSEVYDLDVRFTLYGLVLYQQRVVAPPVEPPGAEGGG